MTNTWDGRPQNPERDGWHFLHHPEDLRPVPTPWNAAYDAWCSGGMHSPQGVIDLGYNYVGPCLLPAEVEARVAAARREGIEAAAKLADGEWCCECPQMLDIGEVCCGSPLRVCDTALPSRIRALLTEGGR